jgi:hypothetical protein
VGAVEDSTALAALAAWPQGLSIGTGIQWAFAEERLGEIGRGLFQTAEIIPLKQVGVAKPASGETATEQLGGAGRGCRFGHHRRCFPTGKPCPWKDFSFSFQAVGCIQGLFWM